MCGVCVCGVCVCVWCVCVCVCGGGGEEGVIIVFGIVLLRTIWLYPSCPFVAGGDDTALKWRVCGGGEGGGGGGGGGNSSYMFKVLYCRESRNHAISVHAVWPQIEQGRGILCFHSTCVGNGQRRHAMCVIL